MKKFLLNITNQSTIGSVLLTMVCFLCWVPNFLSCGQDASFVIQLPVYYAFPIHTNIKLGLNLLYTFLNGLFLSNLLFRFNISRTRKYLPVFLYFLIISANPHLHYALEEQIALTLFLVSVLLVHNMYKKQDGVEAAFLSSLSIMCAAMFLPDMLLLLPVLWLAFLIERAESMRIYLASITGVAVVGLFWVVYLFVYNCFDLFVVALQMLVVRSFIFPITNHLQFLYIVLMLVFLLIGILAYFSNRYQENTITRTVLSSLMIVCVVSIGLLLFPNLSAPNLYIVIALLLCFFSSYLFLSEQRIWRSVVYLLFLLFNISYFVLSSILE